MRNNHIGRDQTSNSNLNQFNNVYLERMSDLTASGQKIFNPWNPRNKELSFNNCIRILKTYGYKSRINDFSLFQKACVHKSYVDRPEEWAEMAAEEGEIMIIAEKPDNCLDLRKEDNEEMEFVGDSVIGCVVATYLRERYPGEGEGFLTRLRTRIVNNKMLGVLAKKIGLNDWLILSKHLEEVCDGRNNLRMTGSMLEAWMCAIYKQEGEPGKGFQICYDWFVTVIETFVNFTELIHDDINYKDQLLRHFQSTYHQPPRYKEVAIEGPPHDRVFTMGVLDPDDKIIASAVARNKKVAEQEASRLALEKLGVEVISFAQIFYV
jgi:ribonuclease-3